MYLSAQKELGPQIWTACRKWVEKTMFQEKIFFRPRGRFFRNPGKFHEIIEFSKPENFVKLPDFEGKITRKTHSNHHKTNVFVVSRFSKWFPTVLVMFPGSLTTEKQSTWIFGSLKEEAAIRPLKVPCVAVPRVIWKMVQNDQNCCFRPRNDMETCHEWFYSASKSYHNP